MGLGVICFYGAPYIHRIDYVPSHESPEIPRIVHVQLNIDIEKEAYVRRDPTAAVSVEAR